MNLEALNIQKNKIKQLNAKGITSLESLLWFFPRKYNDFRYETGVLPKEQKSCLFVNIEKVSAKYQVPQYIEAIGTEIRTGQPICITWFNQMFLDATIRKARGKIVYVCGNVSYNAYRMCNQFVNPDMFSSNIEKAPGIYPVYSKIRGMGEDYIKGLMQRTFAVMEDYIKQEVLPQEEVKRNNLLSREEAFFLRHFPRTDEDIRRARERFDFEKLLYFALKNEWQNRNISIGSPYQIISLARMNEVKASLPFHLTADQEKCVNEMISLIQNGRRLNALVQGDVGSGKSIVAFLITIALASSGHQCVIMAPTQILARQHYNDLQSLIGEKFSVVYLGSELKAAEKKAIKKKIQSGDVDIIVGTHACVAADIQYKDLALCVIDEEHKFGVEQRERLVEKAGKGVHTIKLSATPIPRSLSEIVFGKTTHVFNIKTKPAGRIPVKTGIAVSRERIYRYIVSQVKKGHQIYVVCPMIEENEKMNGVKSVSEIQKEYQAALLPHGIRIGTVTGKDSKAKAEETISSFKAGNLDVLIATSVIEVGVNVPNATGIIICSADRFGLAQLHQIRGRVGRSSFESCCVFEVENPSDKAKERLDVLCRTTDGFEIAEADFKLRGGGDILGTAQSGMDEYIELIKENPQIYQKAKDAAVRILDTPNGCNFLREKILLDNE